MYIDPKGDYSRFGAWWRNKRDGGVGITRTIKTDGSNGSSWGYKTVDKHGNTFFHFGNKGGERWVDRFGGKLNRAFRVLDDFIGKEHPKLPPREYHAEQGGIVFTSANGRNEERRSVGNPDGQVETIDDIGIITGYYGGAGGWASVFERLQRMQDIATALPLAVRGFERTEFYKRWQRGDTCIWVNYNDSHTVITVDKSQVGTRFVAHPDNITFTIDTENK